MAVSNLRQANVMETGGIRVFQPCASKTSQTSVVARSQISDEIAKEALQFILEPSHQPLVLTVATSGSLEVATLVGCLRRLQHWALTAILYEFRLFSPNSPIYDVNRQFIERFDISLITLPTHPPDWLQHEQELWNEEKNHHHHHHRTRKSVDHVNLTLSHRGDNDNSGQGGGDMTNREKINRGEGDRYHKSEEQEDNKEVVEEEEDDRFHYYSTGCVPLISKRTSDKPSSIVSNADYTEDG